MKHALVFTMVIGLLIASGDAAWAERPDPRERAINEKLATTRVSMDFTEAPLRDVVSFIQAVSGINLIVDPQIFKNRTEEELRVTLTVKKITLKNALALLQRFFKLHIEYRDGVLVMTDKKSVGQMKVVVYDVRDMMMKIKDFKGPNIKLQSGAKPGVAIDFVEEKDETGSLNKDTLVELVRDNTGAVWDGEYESAGISMVGGLLVVTHNKEVHAKVRRLLAMMRYYR